MYRKEVAKTPKKQGKKVEKALRHVLKKANVVDGEQAEASKEGCDRACFPIADNRSDIGGWTPGMCSALAGDSRAAAKLMSEDMQGRAMELVECADPALNGSTLLHLAVVSSPALYRPGSIAYSEVLKVFLACGANPFLENQLGVTAFDLALMSHNSRNMRALASFSVFAGVFQVKVPGLFTDNLFQRIFYVVPRFPYCMSTGEPQPKSEAILGRRQNRLSTVLVGFEMYNFWDPMFIVSLENANFRPILDNLGENDEGAIEGVLHFYDPRKKIPGVITKPGHIKGEHELHMRCVCDTPQSAHEIFVDFVNAIEDTHFAVEANNPFQMYNLMIAAAQKAKAKGASTVGNIAKLCLELQPDGRAFHERFRQIPVDPSAALDIIRTPKRIRYPLPEKKPFKLKDLPSMALAFGRELKAELKAAASQKTRSPQKSRSSQTKPAASSERKSAECKEQSDQPATQPQPASVTESALAATVQDIQPQISAVPHQPVASSSKQADQGADPPSPVPVSDDLVLHVMDMLEHDQEGAEPVSSEAKKPRALPVPFMPVTYEEPSEADEPSFQGPSTLLVQNSPRALPIPFMPVTYEEADETDQPCVQGPSTSAVQLRPANSFKPGPSKSLRAAEKEDPGSRAVREVPPFMRVVLSPRRIPRSCLKHTRSAPQLGTASPKPLLRTTASADNLHLPSDSPLSPQKPPADSNGRLSTQKHPAGGKSPLATQKPSTSSKRPSDVSQARPVDDPQPRATPDNSIHINFGPQHPNRTGTQSTTPSKSSKSGKTPILTRLRNRLFSRKSDKESRLAAEAAAAEAAEPSHPVDSGHVTESIEDIRRAIRRVEECKTVMEARLRTGRQCAQMVEDLQSQASNPDNRMQLKKMREFWEDTRRVMANTLFSTPNEAISGMLGASQSTPAVGHQTAQQDALQLPERSDQLPARASQEAPGNLNEAPGNMNEAGPSRGNLRRQWRTAAQRSVSSSGEPAVNVDMDPLSMLYQIHQLSAQCISAMEAQQEDQSAGEGPSLARINTQLPRDLSMIRRLASLAASPVSSSILSSSIFSSSDFDYNTPSGSPQWARRDAPSRASSTESEKQEVPVELFQPRAAGSQSTGSSPNSTAMSSSGGRSRRPRRPNLVSSTDLPELPNRLERGQWTRASIGHTRNEGEGPSQARDWVRQARLVGEDRFTLVVEDPSSSAALDDATLEPVQGIQEAAAVQALHHEGLRDVRLRRSVSLE